MRKLRRCRCLGWVARFTRMLRPVVKKPEPNRPLPQLLLPLGSTSNALRLGDEVPESHLGAVVARQAIRIFFGAAVCFPPKELIMGSRRRGSGRRKVGRKKRRMRARIRHRK